MSKPVPVLVFAHTPPPHHGQSAMVKLMLDGLGDGSHPELEIHHLNARFSDSMEEIGGRSAGKVFRAFSFAWQAVRMRFRYGLRILYYIPAPPKYSAIVRDWILMLLCRPFFPKVVFHWHAVGLGAWMEAAAASRKLRPRIAARITAALLGRHFLSICLTEWGTADAAHFQPQRTIVVGNGIADPCPDFQTTISSHRHRRRGQLLEALRPGGPPAAFQVCFLGHCTAEKGLFEAMEAVALASASLRAASPGITIKLSVAGEFPSTGDRDRYQALMESLTETYYLQPDWIEHCGFVAGQAKHDFLAGADCLCFPTRYAAESFGLVAVEALAFGITPVCSDWRMLPEIMATAGLPTAPSGNPDCLAKEILAAIGRDDPDRLRQVFLDRFTAPVHLRSLAAALASA